MSEVKQKLQGAEVPYPLLVDSRRHPLGWLSERDLRADLVPERADSSPDPVLDSDEVMRDALAELLRSGSQYAPVVDLSGAVAGVLSVEIISEFLGSPAARKEEHTAVERPHD
jgi:CBS domain-containing protein